jgi:enolase-phosphatase E1
VLATQWDSASFRSYRDAFPEEHRGSPEALQAHVEDLTRRDVKVAALKNLQGYLWEDGYKSGAYATTLFPDVVPQLREWKEKGFKLAIYSSGSVFAQKLLFGHVKEANGKSENLTGLFEAWFDTVNAGLKTEASSYSTIAEASKVRSADALLRFETRGKSLTSLLPARRRPDSVPERQREGSRCCPPDKDEVHRGRSRGQCPTVGGRQGPL